MRFQGPCGKVSRPRPNVTGFCSTAAYLPAECGGFDDPPRAFREAPSARNSTTWWHARAGQRTLGLSSLGIVIVVIVVLLLGRSSGRLGWCR
jgi:hypothetical protein